MATVFETRLIGNIGRNAKIKKMERNVIAINFSVAHNKNWKDKKTGEARTKTTWLNCTIWKREGSNMRIADYLTSGTLVEIIGTPYAKTYTLEDGSCKAEIRLNVSKTNILKANKSSQRFSDFDDDNKLDFDHDIDNFDDIDDFPMEEEEF